MRDPLGELRNLAGNLTPQPLPAEEVRRRGDRLRRRRTLVQAVGAAAAVAVVVSGGALVTGSLSTAPVPPGPAEQTESPAPSPTPAPRPGWLTTIPEDFPIDRGLPEPGGDVPPWAWSEDVHTALNADSCRGTEQETLDPVDGRRVQVDPPDEHASRQLLLFEDEAAASGMLERARSADGRCLAQLQGIGSTEDELVEVKWSVESTGSRSAPVVVIEGRTYAKGTETRVPGRSLTRVAQVGNALLVAHVSDASSSAGEDAVTRALASDVDGIVDAMCVFAADPCGGPPSETSSPSPEPAERTTLSDEHLLTAEEIPFNSRFSFVDSGSTEGGVSPCAQDSWAGLGATSVLRRYFVVPERPIETRTAVAEFPDEEAARAAYDRIQDWIDSCPATLLANGYETATLVDARWTPKFRTPGARGVFAELDYGPAPERIDPRGEMGWFRSEGTVLVGRRLSWLSLSAVDVEWHFSLDPRFTDLPLHPFHTAMPRAAERLAAE